MKNNKKTQKKLEINIFWKQLNNVFIYIVIILSAISPLFSGGFEFSYNIPICLILLISAFINLKINCEKIINKPIVYITFVISLASIFMAIFSPNNYLSLGSIIILNAGLFTIISSSHFFKNNKLIIIFSSILVIICGILSIWIFRECAVNSGGGGIFWNKLFNGKLDRIFGTFINPNFYAGYLTMCFPISAGLIFIFKEKKYAYICGFLSVFILINICLTGSKFGIISLFFGILVMLIGLIKNKSINKNTMKTFIGVCVTFIIFLTLFSQTLISRIETANNTQVHSTLFRVYTWKATLDMIEDNILFGVSPGRFAEAYPQYTIASITKHAHCSYLQFASEYGIIILLLCIIGLFFVIRNIKNLNTNIQDKLEIIDYSKINFLYYGILGGIISEIIHNLVDSDLYIGSHIAIFSLLCGIVLSFDKETDIPKLIKFKYQNLILILILGAIWLYSSVYLYEKEEYFKAYYIFPNNYLALRELSKKSNTEVKIEYAKKAKKAAEKDYYSYQFLGDSILAFANIYEDGNNPLILENYEKALMLHPHSTLVMRKIIDWAFTNNRFDLIKKYNKKLIDQEDTLYETLKGVPEIVDLSYAQAHIFFGEISNDKKESIYHYKKAIERYERWISDDSMNFLLVSLVNGQSNINIYEENIQSAIYTYNQLSILENKSYTNQINSLKERFNKLEKEYYQLINSN